MTRAPGVGRSGAGGEPPRAAVEVPAAPASETAFAGPATAPAPGAAGARRKPALVEAAEPVPDERPAKSTPKAPGESAVHLLAAELHDGLSQQLFAAELDVHELRCTPGLPPEVRIVLDRLATRLAMGSKELRGALFKMLEAEREHEEMVSVSDRIRAAVDDFRARQAHAVVLDVSGSGPEPDTAAARLLVRTVREGLANIVKHAGASEVLVVLRRGRRWWTVEVHDDGTGDPVAVRDCAAGAGSFGLFSLVNESSRVGGRLWVTESPERSGVQLSVSVPVGTTRA